MRTMDALERALPDVLEQLGRRDASDVVSDVLARTATLPQRARWRSATWWTAPLREGWLGWPIPRELRVGIVALLLVALLTTLGAVGAALLRKPPPPPSLSTGTWRTDQPAGMNFGDPSGPAQLSFSLTPNARLLVSSSAHGLVDWLRSSVEVERPGLVRLTTTAWTPTGRGRNDGVRTDRDGGSGSRSHAPCLEGDAGRYLWIEEAGHRWLTLVSLGDACPAREAVLSNGLGASQTWFAQVPASGVTPVRLDRLDPTFAISLPERDYLVSGTASSSTVAAVDGSITVRAFVDPRIFRDACDARSGWVPAAFGGDGLLDALGSAAAFDVSQRQTGWIDGHPSWIGLVRASNPNSCGDRVSAAWQGGYETTGAVRHLMAGEATVLAFVSTPEWTVMFDVTDGGDGIDLAQASAILDSVRFDR